MYHHIYKYDDTCDLAKELYVEPEIFSKQMSFLLKHKYQYNQSNNTTKAKTLMVKFIKNSCLEFCTFQSVDLEHRLFYKRINYLDKDISSD